MLVLSFLFFFYEGGHLGAFFFFVLFSCLHDEKDRNDVEKEVGGISCSPSPPPPPFVIYSFVLFVGTGQGDLDTMNGGKGKHWVRLKGI